jgi:hypothetical protein
LKKITKFELVPLVKVMAIARPVEDAETANNLIGFPSPPVKSNTEALPAPPEKGASDGR